MTTSGQIPTDRAGLEAVNGERGGLARQTLRKRTKTNWGALGLAAIMGLLALELFAVRAWLGVGWTGVQKPQPGNTPMPYGIAANLTDNLSYLSWVQQAWRGANVFSVLYTTQPHRPLLFNPFFLAVGRSAALLTVQPILVMNLAGGAGALLTVALVYMAGRVMGLRPRGALLAAALTAFGSGLSWLPYLLKQAGLSNHVPLGADFAAYDGFYDLIPATCFHVYPYQSIGFALTALLLWCVLESERHPGRRWLAATCAAGALLATVRPYEPVAFAAAMGGYLAWSVLNRHQRFAWRPRGLATGAALLGLLPPMIYSAWVSHQPVWQTFARRSLTQARGASYWLLGFGVLWLAALAGLPLARRAGVKAGLAAAWAVFLLILLLVPGMGWPKLAAGGFLSLALLTGLTLDSLLTWGERTPGDYMRRAAARVIAVITLGATMISPFLAFGFFKQIAPKVEPGLIRVAGLIRGRSRNLTPLVLTDSQAGPLLPGLAGARVYLGHWALTPDYFQKLEEIITAGMDDQPEKNPPTAAQQRAAFARLFKKGQFEFILARHTSPAYAFLAGRPGFRIIFEGVRWRLYQVDPAARFPPAS